MEFHDFPIILGMSSSQLTNSMIFQRGRLKPPTSSASVCFSQKIQKGQSKCETSRNCWKFLRNSGEATKFWTAKCSLRVKQPWLPWCFDLDRFRLLVADTSHPFGSFFGKCPVIFSLCISPSSAFHPEPYPRRPLQQLMAEMKAASTGPGARNGRLVIAWFAGLLIHPFITQIGAVQKPPQRRKHCFMLLWWSTSKSMCELWSSMGDVFVVASMFSWLIVLLPITVQPSRCQKSTASGYCSNLRFAEAIVRSNLW